MNTANEEAGAMGTEQNLQKANDYFRADQGLIALVPTPTDSAQSMADVQAVLVSTRPELSSPSSVRHVFHSSSNR
jgi:hypothetical protein